jgi:hypothetical protein
MPDIRQEDFNNRGLGVMTVPTPTDAYMGHENIQNVAWHPRIPLPRRRIPYPVFRGARVLIWKQDPTVAEIGIRKAYLPKRVYSGPRDARILSQGLPTVSPNVFGDLIVSPTSAEAFDSVHTFSVVRMALTMYERSVGHALPWQWNTGGNIEQVNVFAHAGETMNAYYSRSQKALKFFFFTEPGEPATSPKVYTCRSFDIVSHEAGHAILDGLKPEWLSWGNPPQTGGLHESFGDLTAIFLALSQLDQVEALIAHTKANLHAKNFLSDVAEQFGLALGRPNGLRNADNNLKLSEVSNEVHAISKVFTGGVYDIMADIFNIERNPTKKDDAAVLYEVGQYVCSLVMRAFMTAPNTGANYTDVANRMIQLTIDDSKPLAYRNSILNRFTFREVFTAGATLPASGKPIRLTPGFEDEEDIHQDRCGCCGTMQLEEYLDVEDEIADERKILCDEFEHLHKDLEACTHMPNGKSKTRR